MEQKLFCFAKPKKKPNPHPHLFVARYAGQLWHADIHYVTIDEAQYYLLGFIDDRSRLLLHYEVLPMKTSDLCGMVLIRALNKVPIRPKMLTIDNGGKFVGESFQQVLSSYQIEQFRTHPNTPQQNGKIERFWLTIERAKGPNVPWSLLKISELVYVYNNFWPHRSLKILTHQKTTPCEALNSMVKYSGQQDADIEMIK
ncbi:Integrase core domain containing protein [Histomonas meleagridis]|uniref:Integrase core domain containing protein n=1 Tax=Histomonas meleagridis TaxID=135588 RepID=UPI00355AB826|nr:Integrase core domain containing protein [Histomonas meleagridis]KAH0804543.1 Integrase core domain containing protein [Histomonas meleagridis]